MIVYTTANTEEELFGILSLQKANRAEVLTEDQIASQGFITVTHRYDELKRLNDIEKHVIAKDGQEVIAYVLAMTAQSKYDLPILVPMFELFDSLSYAGKIISTYNYMVVGQVCVDKRYRGKGMLDSCYDEYKKLYAASYDFAITEIVSTNQRSLNAHKRIGFQEINRYTAPDKTEWCIVLWDWRNSR